MKTGKWLALVLAFVMVFTAVGCDALAQEPETALPAFEMSPYSGDTAEQFRASFSYYDDTQAFLIGDPITGKVLVEKNSDTPLGIASMSKLMTYYIVKSAIRDGSLQPEQPVVVSPTAAEFNVAGSSNYGLVAGETLTVERLLFGMMVVSGNDAAEQLSEVVAGSEAEFTKLMNAKAAELGMTKTNFVNASGFTVNGQYNTASARDMFLLSSTILREFPEIEDYIRTTQVDEPSRNFKEESTISKATLSIPNMTGLKTGMTEEAGYCFTGSFHLTSAVDGAKFDAVTVVMGAPIEDARWRMTKELVDLAVGSFSNVKVIDASKPIERYALPSSQEGSVVLYPAESLSVLTFANKAFDIRYHVDEKVKAPTEAEQKFGEIEVYQDEQLIRLVDIVSHAPTTSADLITRVQRGVESFVTFVAGLL